MSALLRIWAVCFFTAFVIFSPPSLYAVEPAGDVSAKLRIIEDRLKKIEEGQKQINEKEEKVLSEIDNLRVWIRANC